MKDAKNVEYKRCLQNHFGPVEKLLVKQYPTWQCGQHSTKTLKVL